MTYYSPATFKSLVEKYSPQHSNSIVEKYYGANSSLNMFFTSTTGVGVTVSHSTLEGGALLSASSSITGSSSIQSIYNHKLFGYFPGYFVLTFKFGAETSSSLERRVGAYISGDSGIYLREINGVLAIVILNNGSTTVINRSSWSIDKLDGTGPSEKTFSQTDVNTLVMFSAGYSFKIGFIYSGEIFWIHEFSTNPVLSGNMSILRAELSSTGSSIGGTMILYSGLIGEVNPLLRCTSIGFSRLTSNIVIQTAGLIYPLLSIRQPNINRSQLFVHSYYLVGSTNAINNTFLSFSPTTTGTDAARWTSISGSNIEFDRSRTNTYIISSSNGQPIALRNILSTTGNQAIPSNIVLPTPVPIPVLTNNTESILGVTASSNAGGYTGSLILLEAM